MTLAHARRARGRARAAQRASTFAARTGAFKFRGRVHVHGGAVGRRAGARACARLSSGNHAQAVAIWRRAELGVRAAILMPEDAPAAKLEATAGLRRRRSWTYDRYSRPQVEAGLAVRAGARPGLTCRRSTTRSSAAGQGTAALELLEDCATRRTRSSVQIGGGGTIERLGDGREGAVARRSRVVGVEAGGARRRHEEVRWRRGDASTSSPAADLADGQMLDDARGVHVRDRARAGRRDRARERRRRSSTRCASCSTG